MKAEEILAQAVIFYAMHTSIAWATNELSFNVLRLNHISC
jgi:hypothetical protein